MKPSFKTTTIIATIGMTIYTYYSIVRSIPAMVWLHISNLRGPLHDIFYATWMYLFLGRVIITIIAILRHRTSEPTMPRLRFRMTTYTLTVLLSFCIIGALLPYPIYIEGMPYLYIRFPMNIILLTLATIWLWMLCRQSSLGPISKPLRVAMMISIGLLALPILLQIISATSYWLTGELLFLRSWAIYSWIRIFVPTILLCWYSIELHKNNHLQSCNES